MPSSIHVSITEGSCCCGTGTGTPFDCECHATSPPEILCADISGCARCTEINRRYRLVKYSDMGAYASSGFVQFYPGFPLVPIEDLDWWHAKCQVGCGAWHHVAIFKFKEDNCSYSVDDWFTADEAGDSIYANWGVYPNPVVPVTTLHCNPDFNFVKNITSNRLYMGLGESCENCATLQDYLDAGSQSDSFDISVFIDPTCDGCLGTGSGTGTGTGNCNCPPETAVCVSTRTGTAPDEPPTGGAPPEADNIPDCVELTYQGDCIWGAEITGFGWTVTVELGAVGDHATVLFQSVMGESALYQSVSPMPDLVCNTSEVAVIEYVSSVGTATWPEFMNLRVSGGECCG